MPSRALAPPCLVITKYTVRAWIMISAVLTSEVSLSAVAEAMIERQKKAKQEEEQKRKAKQEGKKRNDDHLDEREQPSAPECPVC